MELVCERYDFYDGMDVLTFVLENVYTPKEEAIIMVKKRRIILKKAPMEKNFKASFELNGDNGMLFINGEVVVIEWWNEEGGVLRVVGERLKSFNEEDEIWEIKKVEYCE